jgi:hypothetical protein
MPRDYQLNLPLQAIFLREGIVHSPRYDSRRNLNFTGEAPGDAGNGRNINLELD